MATTQVNDAAAMQLRVLCGPHAGCWLPLVSGSYSVGSDEACDVVLEGSQPRIAFAIYVGHQTLALEALMDGLRLEGRQVRGLCEVRPGVLFELGEWLFTVADAGAPWPDHPETLRPVRRDDGAPEQSSAVPDARNHADDEAPAEDVAAVPASANTPAEDVEFSGQPDPVLAPDVPAESRPTAEVTVRPRRAPPFWVVWLAGTALFLAVGTVVLVLSLRPDRSPPMADGGGIIRTLEQLAAAATGPQGDVNLEHLPDGRLRLAGRVATRRQKFDLLRQVRAAEPGVLIQVLADEDLEALTRDTLARFAGTDVELAGLHLGRLTLKGHVATGALRDKIVAAIWDGVPGLSSVDDAVTSNEDSLAVLHELLADANLGARISGRLERGSLIVTGSPDEAEHRRWLEVHGRLTARFGEQLPIVESFDAPLAARESSPPSPHRPEFRGDVVAVVMGQVPYALLRNGTKVATSPDAPAEAQWLPRQ